MLADVDRAIEAMRHEGGNQVEGALEDRSDSCGRSVQGHPVSLREKKRAGMAAVRGW
jgi:hypothetical protein